MAGVWTGGPCGPECPCCERFRELARENERLRKRLAFYADRGTWERVEEFNATGWMYSGDEEPWEMAAAALAVDPRETDTSHLIPIPGKPVGFTNRNYRRPAAEPREPDGEANE